MKILFVAPRSNLAVGIELARVASGNEISVVDGIVDRDKLAYALRDKQFDVVHFAQHGNRSGLELSDGVLEASDLISMLEQQRHLRLFVVNACDSVATGIALHNAFHVPVIAHDAAIEDAAALAFAETFYRALRTTSIEIAYQRALKTLQVRYPNDQRTPQLVNGDMVAKGCLDDLRHEIHEMFGHLNNRLDEVEAKVIALDSGRGRHVSVTIALLVALLVAQLLTPLLNALLVR